MVPSLLSENEVDIGIVRDADAVIVESNDWESVRDAFEQPKTLDITTCLPLWLVAASLFNVCRIELIRHCY